MAIKGLTTARKGGFTHLGVLRKGAPKNSGRWGKDLDGYFRFTSDDPSVERQFNEVFGERPTNIEVYFVHATVDENFDAWIEEYSASGLQWRGDGEKLVRLLTPSGYKSWAVGDENAPDQPNGGKAVGRLKVVVPALGRLGYVTVLTHSINDIATIHNCLLGVQSMSSDLRGIPFILSRVSRKISTPTNKTDATKRARRDKSLIQIEAAPQWVSAQLSGMSENALRIAANKQPLQIEARVIDGDTGEIFDDETERVSSYYEDEIPDMEAADFQDIREDGDIVEQQDRSLFIKFQTAGKQAYGKEWDETRPKFVAWLTNGAVTSSKDLSNTSLQGGIDKLNLRIKSNEEQVSMYEKYLELIADCYKYDEEQESVMESHANQAGLPDMKEAKVSTLTKFIAELQARLYAQAESVGNDAPF